MFEPCIRFAVAPGWVEPFFPRMGQAVSFLVDVRGQVDRLLLQAVIAGTTRNAAFEKSAELSDGWTRWKITMEIREKLFVFSIVALRANRSWYLGSEGLGRVAPGDPGKFQLLTDLAAPSWVAEGVFYQIFPDRFRRGNPELGVQDGEYEFDGGTSRALPWDAQPLPWSEGRCVDFFNGDLEGIRQSIPHFQELGISSLYLNPIFHSRTHHRYDTIDFSNVDPHLGGNEALALLSEDLHAAGIRLVLDVSINHTGTDHPWFKSAMADEGHQDFYYLDGEGGYLAWYGVPTLPQLNYGSRDLQRRMWEDEDSLVRKFLRPPFNIDGWRFDVAAQTGKTSTEDHAGDIWQAVRASAKGERADSYILAEYWDDPWRWLQGRHWDAAMNYFGCARPIRSWLGDRDRYLVIPHEYPPQPVDPWTTEELARGLEEGFRRLPGQMHFLQCNLVGSHDISRLHLLDAFRGPGGEALYRSAILCQFLLPGTPMVYYGDEIGLGGHSESHEGVRFPMEWDRTKWDGSRFAFYAELCRLRRSSRALTWGRTEVLFADEDCLAILRATPDSAAIGVVNRSVEARSLSIDLTSLPPGERRAVLAAVERGRVVSSLPESGAGAAAVAVAPVARAAREPSVAAEIGTTIHLEARESGIWVSE